MGLSGINSLLFTIYIFWLTTYRTWQFDTSTYNDAFGGNFYWMQANAMLNGRLHLQTEGFECIVLEGNCHGYFGPFPSIIRLPLAFLFDASYKGFTPVFIAVAAGLTLFSFAHLLSYIAVRHENFQCTVFNIFSLQIFTLLLGFSSVLVLSAHPRVYEEAIMWSVAMMSIAINFAYRWYIEKRDIYLGLVLLSSCCAVLSRVTSVPFTMVIGAGLFFVAWHRRQTKSILWSLGIAALPISLYLGYSLLNLGFIGFDATNYWPYNNILIFRNIIENNDGATLGLQFLPTVIANHVRFDNLAFGLDWPFISVVQDWFGRSRYIAPMTQKRMFISYSPGLLAVVPGTFLIGVVGVVLLWRRRNSVFSSNKLMLALLLVATLGTAGMSMSYFAMNARYLTDLYPVLSMGLIIFSVYFFAEPLVSKKKVAFITVLSVACLYSFVAMISIHTDIVPFL